MAFRRLDNVSLQIPWLCVCCLASFLPAQEEMAKAKWVMASRRQLWSSGAAAVTVVLWACQKNTQFVLLFGVISSEAWKWLFCRPSWKLNFPAICFLPGVFVQFSLEAETLHSLQVVAFSFLRRWKLSRWARGRCHIHCPDGWLPSREGCSASWSARPRVLNFPGVLQIRHQVQGRWWPGLHATRLNQVCAQWRPAHCPVLRRMGIALFPVA